MKVLITGVNGYIGTQMAQVLKKHGHDVSGLDANFYTEGWLYGNPEEYTIDVIKKDTRKITFDDVKGFDAIIHLADLSNDPLGQQDKSLTYEINFDATVNLANLAKAAGVKRFIYSSSCSAYGIATEDMVSEESIVNPQTAYAECKVKVENELMTMADENFSPTMMRNATVYGASPRMRFDLVVNNLSGLAWTTNEIKMTSDGTPWRPLVHILDVCEAFAQVLEAPRETIHKQILNVGSSNGNYTIKQVAEIIAKVFVGCTVSFGNSDGDTRSYKVSFDKITNVLPNYQAKRTVEDGAKELKEVFEQIKMSKDDFAFRAFTRLKEIQYLQETNQIDNKFFWI